jgi:hypothetical protein
VMRGIRSYPSTHITNGSLSWIMMDMLWL